MHEATAILKAKEDVHGSCVNASYIGLEVTRDIPQIQTHTVLQVDSVS